MIATEASCKKYNLEVDILSHSSEYAVLFEQNRDLFEHVSRHSGRPMEKKNVFLAIQNMINVYTCLNIEVRVYFSFEKLHQRKYLSPVNANIFSSSAKRKIVV